MKVNYKQLIFAREYRGYTQTELASNIKGLSQSNLSKFEKGFGPLSDDILEKIIIFLGFPVKFYETKISNKVEIAHYRKRSALTKAEKSRIEYTNKLIGYILDKMSESIILPDFTFKVLNVDDGFDPKSIALYTRKFLKLGDEPVTDICSILEENGIIIVEYDAKNDNFDGVSFMTDNGYHIIIINKSFSNDRKRYTIAHELGHIIMHMSPDFIISDYRDIEKEADIFASEFLMPSEIIKNSLLNLKLSSLSSLKQYWLTSMASIIRKAKDLGYISKDRYQIFNIEMSRRGFKKQEPIKVYIDSPTIFRDAYQIHIKDLCYTDDELVKAFNLPIDIIREIASQKNNIISIRPIKAV